MQQQEIWSILIERNENIFISKIIRLLALV